MDDADFISEFEELLKIKDFFQKPEMKIPFDCTYELIAKALKDEYSQNINEKIKRWVNVTHIMYFENVKPVKYYFQSKMLYRDGYYEASIALSRTVCELICYDLLSKIAHPFGNLESIEVPIFRVFVNFLAIPKRIERDIFEENIISKIDKLEDKNIIKSSYELDKSINIYNFKVSCGQKKSNLERFFSIFRDVDFNNIDTFENDTHRYLHLVYDIGNKYIHAKEIQNIPREDAAESLNMLAHILSDVYGVKAITVNKKIKSGYSDFPDICKGMNFAISFAVTPDEAQRIYFNIPSEHYYESMKHTAGEWQGKWKNIEGEMVTGVLNLYWETPEHLNANIRYNNENQERIEPLEIKLFGNYFHLIGFDEEDNMHKKGEHVFFELEFFNDNFLIGKNIENNGTAFFERIN